ncbi:hypothetical protein J6590_069542 [Homalodisca vitripennis]|nr:hypothetical protein J6590_069542 [Homalodisca vitripennis]
MNVCLHRTLFFRKALFFSSLICAAKEFFINKNLSVRPEEMDEFYEFVDKATPSCDEMIRRCYWQNVEFPCCKIFFPIITSLGRCYIINSLPSDMLFTYQTDKKFLFNDSYPQDTRYWSPENGYPRPDQRGLEGDSTYPKWADTPGYEGGLSVEIEEDMSEWQDVCAGGYSGFKVLVNSPEEAPITSQAALRTPMKHDFLVKLFPRTIRTDLSLSSTHARLRGCLFQKERKLQHFGTYTQNNCMLECLMNSALELCHCVPFYMPRKTHHLAC